MPKKEIYKKPTLPTLSSKNSLSRNSDTNLDRFDERAEEILNKYRTKRHCNLMGLFDATGSMDSVWDSTRKCLQEVIRRLTEIGSFSIKWVAYRDYTEGNMITECSEWETDECNISEYLQKIKCFGGGDWEEAVEKGLEVAVADNAVSRVLLIGDAPPHPEKDFILQSKKLAQLERPVFSFVVGDDKDAFAAFEKISATTGGVCTWLKSPKDIIDAIIITVAHEIGGNTLIEDYKNKYKLTKTGDEFSSKLLTWSEK